jgi:Spy/CpxP family protein refolding chaperone
VRESLGSLQLGRVADVGLVIESFGDESFDRAKIEQAAQSKGEALAQAKKVIADALERLHDILIPEQRRRLREILGRFAFRRGAGADGGPYRTAL